MNSKKVKNVKIVNFFRNDARFFLIIYLAQFGGVINSKGIGSALDWLHKCFDALS